MNLEDRAQEREAKYWAMANMDREGLPPLKAPGDPGYGPEDCHSCGAEMPALRRANGWVLCTACQTQVERKSVR